MQRILTLSRLRSTAPSLPLPLRLPRHLATMTGAAETDTQASTIAHSSGITPSSLQKTLTEKLEASHVDIEDMSGTSPPLLPFAKASNR